MYALKVVIQMLRKERFLDMFPFSRILLVATGAVCVFGSLPAYADVIVSLQSVTANGGSTGNALEVTLTNSSGGANVTIGSFAFGISTTDLDIRFTDATTSTTDPYIFSGHSLFGPSLVFPAIPPPGAQSLNASDLYDIPLSGVTLSPGVTVGLGHILFDVLPGAQGGTFAVGLDPILTSLSDPSGVGIDVSTLSAGTIEINSVPEPSSLFLLLSVILLFGGIGLLPRIFRKLELRDFRSTYGMIESHEPNSRPAAGGPY